jgi:hypothetical protein
MGGGGWIILDSGGGMVFAARKWGGGIPSVRDWNMSGFGSFYVFLHKEFIMIIPLEECEMDSHSRQSKPFVEGSEEIVWIIRENSIFLIQSYRNRASE